MKKDDPEPTRRKRSYKRIPAAYDKELFALAVELSEKYLHQLPDDYFAWMWYAMAKTKLCRYDDAEKAVRRAMSLWQYGKLEIALRQMGDIFKAKGELKKAKLWYRRAALRDPKGTHYHIYLGDLAFGQGHLRQAELHFRRAVKCRKSPVEEAYYNLGGVLLAKKRYTEAIACYRKAIQIDSKYTLAKKRLKDAQLAVHLKNS